MRINLAWKNLLLNRKRTLVALLGIGFSVMLMFMQLGFLRGMRYNATILYDAFAADLVIASENYLNLRLKEPFDSTRLVQARLVPGVERVGVLNVAFAEWKDKATELTRACAIVAAPDDPAFVRHEGIRAGLPALAATRSVLVDELSDGGFGPTAPGTVAEIADQNVNVAGNYRMGLALYAKGAVVTGQETFRALTRSDSRRVDFGLVQLAPGADRAAAMAALEAALPSDVLVLEKEAMMRAEQDYYLEEKPVGIIFRVGALVSFIVGSVIFYQVLSAEIANKLREFATLKALGFADRYVYLVGIRQALLYAALSYVPCALLMAGLFQLISRGAKMKLGVDLPLAGLVLAFTIVMCGLAGTLALRRVRRADPAELF